MYGIDISSHQMGSTPGGFTYNSLAKQGCEFAIARACYGSKPDNMAVKHMTVARSAGMKVGAYVFFRGLVDPEEQAEAFILRAREMGYQPGDIAPAVDLEDDLHLAIKPEHAPAACELVARLHEAFGEVIIYTSTFYWKKMGEPAWVLDHPLWIAHYTTDAVPSTPGHKPWTLWQHRVGPYVLNGPGGDHSANGSALDQNRAVSLPLCSRVP